jgi:hypothetical protein
MKRTRSSRQAPKPESAPVTGDAQGHSPEYHVAALPPEDVAKLQHIEEELAADTGEEIVVVAYEKQKTPSGRSR